jgi:hypothetical protein
MIGLVLPPQIENLRLRSAGVHLGFRSAQEPESGQELSPKGLDQAQTLATATADRLLHHVHIRQSSGESVRLSQALAGQGVSPLH